MKPPTLVNAFSTSVDVCRCACVIRERSLGVAASSHDDKSTTGTDLSSPIVLFFPFSLHNNSKASNQKCVTYTINFNNQRHYKPGVVLYRDVEWMKEVL